MRLDAEVWEDEKVAKHVAKDFVALKLWTNRDPKVKERFGDLAAPSVGVLDKEGKPLAIALGAPFWNPDECIAWLDKIVNTLDSLKDLERTAESTEVDACGKLARAYLTLYRWQSAADAARMPKDAVKLRLEVIDELGKHYREAAPISHKLATETLDLLKKDDDRRTDLQITIAGLKLHRDVGERDKAIALYRELLGPLAKAGDHRAGDVCLRLTKLTVDTFTKRGDELKDACVEARKLIAETQAAIPKDSQWRPELRYSAAYYAAAMGDTETARKEYKSLIADEPKDSRWANYAEGQLKQLDKKK